MSYHYFSETKDAALNEATEQYLLSFPEETILFLWQNQDWQKEMPGGESLMGFSLFCPQAQFQPNQQTAVFMRALEYLDIGCRCKENALWAGEKAICQWQMLPRGQSMVCRGFFLLSPNAQLLCRLSRHFQHDFLGLCAFNPFLSPSFLWASLKYAFECQFGKSQELCLDAGKIVQMQKEASLALAAEI